MRVMTFLGLCALIAVAGCTDRGSSPAPPERTASPAPVDRDAELLAALAEGPYAGLVTSRAWNDDVVQVGVRAGRGTARDRLGLCTDLAGKLGTGHGVDQILVTPGDDLPVVRWTARHRTCTQDPAKP